MGSAWTAKLAGPLPASAEVLRAGAQARFDAVNLALSTYRADSGAEPLQRDDSGEWVGHRCGARRGAGVCAESRGGERRRVRRDGRAAGQPLGLRSRSGDANQVPAAAAIEAARARVGWRWRRGRPRRTDRARKRPGMRVDLSSLGKGRGVDRVAEYLDAQGVTNYLIDLSGKLRARGRNAQRRAVARRRGASRGRCTSGRAGDRARDRCRCRTKACHRPATIAASSRAAAGTITAHHRSTHRLSVDTATVSRYRR